MYIEGWLLAKHEATGDKASRPPAPPPSIGSTGPSQMIRVFKGKDVKALENSNSAQWKEMIPSASS
ncbi:unnamed protein product [Prunus armeniaca]|uniref:Uncharacterized protein n=1 Tax=Prunus armeniaca TaxID=36596 RepID=A0A6J5Y643_PRUAR|nr:unnamed protein product [Prunus armeniaca]